MVNFNAAFDITMGHEGGYVNHPNDRGGETYRGIARRFHPHWPGWRIIDHMKQRPGFPGNLSLQQLQLDVYVKDFYKIHFWNVNRLDELKSVRLAWKMFDIGVNCGTTTAAIMLQRSLNIMNRNQQSWPDIATDGRIGPITLRTANRHPEPDLLVICLAGFQFMHYVQICERDPSQEVFFNGWLKRV